MKILFLILLTFGCFSQTYSQVNGIVIIDYKSNLPIPNVQISSADSDPIETNNLGQFSFTHQLTEKVKIKLIGYHETYIDSYSLSITDTVYLFAYKSTMTKFESKFRKNKNIKNGKIIFIKNKLKYVYDYDDSKLTLDLKVAYAR